MSMSLRDPGSAGSASGHQDSAEGVGQVTHSSHSEAEQYSIWPIVVALGVLIAGIGALAWIPISAVGLVVIIAAVAGWLWQPWEPA